MHFFKQIVFISIGCIILLCNNNPINSDDNIVTDIDGNSYKTVKLGTQVWLYENYRATRYNDGTVIPLITSDSVWSAMYDTPADAYCLYNNTNNVDSIKKYGVLYNWNTVNKKNFAPAGWHVPSDSEWEILDNYLTENGKNYLDTSGFSTIYGGYRYYNGEFVDKGECSRWWSSTERGETQSYCHLICSTWKDIDDFTDISAGLPVRLIKD